MINRDYSWVKDLKVGDQVAIDKSNGWNRNYYIIATVEKITPTGRLKLSTGDAYYQDGKKVGGRSFLSDLKTVTPEILNLVKRRELLNKLKIDEFKGRLSVERLETLLEWQEELLKDKEV